MQLMLCAQQDSKKKSLRKPQSCPARGVAGQRTRRTSRLLTSQRESNKYPACLYRLEPRCETSLPNMSRSFLVRVSPVDGADGAPATGATETTMVDGKMPLVYALVSERSMRQQEMVNGLPDRGAVCRVVSGWVVSVRRQWSGAWTLRFADVLAAVIPATSNNLDPLRGWTSCFVEARQDCTKPRRLIAIRLLHLPP